ncbi:cytochrome P450 [Coprinopsis marcescibilis]|uniref:Cytochrome P450 n=1 Tax=Coprinopsis marcescibilis TaxID=230819 RepID=A0A5C3L287_COPMA|nr:cytochrome P450 [Coprinopsis marcescibilis]
MIPTSPFSSLEALAALAVTFVAWKFLRALTRKDSLHTVPGPKGSYLTGCVAEMFHADAWDFHNSLAKNYPGIARVPAIMGHSVLHVSDPKALYHVMLKDQSTFDETDDFLRVNKLVFGPGLFATMGETHRKQRKMLNPVFSIAHMREMVPIFYNVGYKLRDSIRLEISRGKTEIDILSWMSRTALELIGQSGLGYSFDKLEPDSEPHVFYKSLKNLMQSQASFALARIVVLPRVADIGSPRFRRLVVDLLPWKRLHDLRDMVDVMHNTSVEIYESKKRALEMGDQDLADQVGNGKDVMSILLKANLAASEEERMPEDELIGQMSTITFAGMDTTSNALSRTLLLLSEHHDIQEKLRKEIIDAKREHGELMYDELHHLPYLDAICRETLRLHPPVPFVVRQANQDAVLPVSRPFTSLDGKETNEVLVPHGTTLVISVMACNRDPLIWGPDAHEWKPERWLSPLPDSVVNAKVPGVYSHLMTFVGGSRACIGFKFSQLEMKVILCLLLESFRFDTTEKKIKWQFVGVTQPAIDEPSAGAPKLQMPLKVSLL